MLATNITLNIGDDAHLPVWKCFSRQMADVACRFYFGRKFHSGKNPKP
jgi:hypothetical protein